LFDRQAGGAKQQPAEEIPDCLQRGFLACAPGTGALFEVKVLPGDALAPRMPDDHDVGRLLRCALTPVLLNILRQHKGASAHARFAK